MLPVLLIFNNNNKKKIKQIVEVGTYYVDLPVPNEPVRENFGNCTTTLTSLTKSY